MRWIDGHCDVLYKIWKAPRDHSFYEAVSKLDVRFFEAQKAGVGLQVFAVWVPPEVHRSHAWQVALRQVDHFYEHVIQDGKRVIPVLSREDMDRLGKTGKMGALLSLEGADALQGELVYLRILHRLGLRQVGLTWNHANEAADGIEEPRGGGLTRFGRELVSEMIRLGMVLDVSHLSVKGFWEVMEANIPVVASHSNCRAVCPHVRNLDDDQIRALIQKDGIIGITFVPKFVRLPAEEATVDELLRHIDHVCGLGGEHCLAFGSDFDGTVEKIPGLEHVGHLTALEDVLLRRYPEGLVRRWMKEHWRRFYMTHLS